MIGAEILLKNSKTSPSGSFLRAFFRIPCCNRVSIAEVVLGMVNLDVNQLLPKARHLTPEGADLVLDLRELLLKRGHPGDCVQCFFGLLGNLDRPGSLAPLRHWLESNLEVAVEINQQIRETLPVRFGKTSSLNDYCQHVASLIRKDRNYTEKRITLSFQYC